MYFITCFRKLESEDEISDSRTFGFFPTLKAVKKR